VKGV